MSPGAGAHSASSPGTVPWHHTGSAQPVCGAEEESGTGRHPALNDLCSFLLPVESPSNFRESLQGEIFKGIMNLTCIIWGLSVDLGC